MSQTHRNDRAESSVWRSLSADEAAQVLVEAHEGQAGEEALFHAFLAERDMDGTRAGFWVEVYGLIRQGREG